MSSEYKIVVLAAKETETITIKQENGLLLQYELPVEHDPQGQWTRTLVKTPSSAVVTKAPGPRKRGRPRKYPNEQGQIGKNYIIFLVPITPIIVIQVISLVKTMDMLIIVSVFVDSSQ